jgi:hypothetical protein
MGGGVVPGWVVRARSWVRGTLRMGHAHAAPRGFVAGGTSRSARAVAFTRQRGRGGRGVCSGRHPGTRGTGVWLRRVIPVQIRRDLVMTSPI